MSFSTQFLVSFWFLSSSDKTQQKKKRPLKRLTPLRQFTVGGHFSALIGSSHSTPHAGSVVGFLKTSACLSEPPLRHILWMSAPQNCWVSSYTYLLFCAAICEMPSFLWNIPGKEKTDKNSKWGQWQREKPICIFMTDTMQIVLNSKRKKVNKYCTTGSAQSQYYFWVQLLLFVANIGCVCASLGQLTAEEGNIERKLQVAQPKLQWQQRTLGSNGTTRPFRLSPPTSLFIKLRIQGTLY